MKHWGTLPITCHILLQKVSPFINVKWNHAVMSMWLLRPLSCSLMLGQRL